MSCTDDTRERSDGPGRTGNPGRPVHALVHGVVFLVTVRDTPPVADGDPSAAGREARRPPHVAWSAVRPVTSVLVTYAGTGRKSALG